MAKWKGTVVPNSGYVDKVYFNTNLSVEEVVAILSSLEYNEIGAGFILASEDYSIIIGFTYIEGNYGILNAVTNEFYFISDDLGLGFVGWNTAISYPLIINNNVVNSFQMEDNNFVSGTQNNLLTELFSITPFTQSQPTTADKLQKLVNGKQYVIDKTNTKAGSDLKINSTWQSIGDVIERIESGGGGQELADSIIDGTIENLTTNVEKIADYKFYNGSTLKNVDAPNATEIGANAFNGCSNLESVNIPLVTSMGDQIFYKCTNLESIDIPLITSLPTNTFMQCTNLKNVNIPLVTSMGNSPFFQCNSLESIDLPLITSVGSATFKGSARLKSVNLPLLKNLTNEIFYNCSQLESVNLPLVTNTYSNAFGNCNSLESIDLPSVTYIRSLTFSICRKLKNVKLPKVTTIDGTSFRYCDVLTNVYLGYEGIVTLSKTDAFYQCPSFTVHVRANYADQYATATNWSSLIAGGTITIVGDYSD